MVELGHAAKAMVLVEPRQLAATKIPSQPVAAGGWLAVEATAISGADVQAWHGERREVQYPLIPGHQVVGRIAIADDTIPYEIGTRVVLEPVIRCGQCNRCKLGLATCQMRKPSNTYGLIPSTEPPALWGGMAEYLYIDPHATIHPVTDDVPAEVATSVHSLATGHTWAVQLPDLRAGDRVLILGPGPRGLACVLAAKAAGAFWVGITGLSHDRDRLDLALRLGADMALDIERHPDLASSIADSTGCRPDIVVDVTSDDPEAVFTALDIVRSGGRVVLASTKGNRALHFFSDVLVTKQLLVRGAMGASTESYAWATERIATDERVDGLVSHQFPLDEAQRAMQAAAGLLGHDELIAVAVTF
ncbi:MAG TPA: alcohol dehydrogenase catalytic domain-containing protein [Acidimicrobiia bacterium]|nr:alcohol dehydrogenase catalytic domain-containing protein [Acidimicrobiia bacterium]